MQYENFALKPQSKLLFLILENENDIKCCYKPAGHIVRGFKIITDSTIPFRFTPDVVKKLLDFVMAVASESISNLMLRIPGN